jgi:ubiquitin-conjugating enzyme E2 variant
MDPGDPGVEALEQGYAGSHRLYELCGIGATLITGIWLGTRLLAGPLHAWWLPPSLIIGMLGADLVSGLVHWFFDTWGDLDTPIVGRLVIRAFRQHHLDPKAMLRHGFVETNGHNMMLALPLTLGGLCMVPARGVGGEMAFVGLCLLMIAVGVSLTNQIHKWAHAPCPPRPVVLLQQAGLILSPTHHRFHHLAPYQRNYCITVGWLNGPLRATRAFERLEALIAWLTGATPRPDQHG